MRQQRYSHYVALPGRVYGLVRVIALTFLLALEDVYGFRRSPDVGWQSRTAAGREELGVVGGIYQQGRWSLFANAAGARSAAHSGTTWGALRSAALGTEVG